MAPPVPVQPEPELRPQPRPSARDEPPEEVLKAKRPPVRAAEGPYSDEEEQDRASFREWKLRRYDRPFTLGLSAGYGIALDSAAQDPAGNAVALASPYKAGFGLQFGYTTPRYHVYAGGAAAFSLGEGIYSALRASFDLGYEFMMPAVRLRPVFSVGMSTLFVDDDTQGNQYNPLFGLGLLFFVPAGPVYLGADLRIDFVAGRSMAAANTLSLAGVFGLRL